MVISIRTPFCKAFLPWTLVLFTGATFAQPPAHADAPKSVLPTSLQYSSAIDAYQGYTDQSVQSWRQANDRVGRIGGWRAYAKEIKTGKPAKDAVSDDPHAGHGKGAQP